MLILGAVNYICSNVSRYSVQMIAYLRAQYILRDMLRGKQTYKGCEQRVVRVDFTMTELTVN